MRAANRLIGQAKLRTGSIERVISRGKLLIGMVLAGEQQLTEKGSPDDCQPATKFGRVWSADSGPFRQSPFPSTTKGRQ
jgi:hypothetical protein